MDYYIRLTVTAAKKKKKGKKEVWIHCTASGAVGRREIEHSQA
jgi:hypothetical protein